MSYALEFSMHSYFNCHFIYSFFFFKTGIASLGKLTDFEIQQWKEAVRKKLILLMAFVFLIIISSFLCTNH